MDILGLDAICELLLYLATWLGSILVLTRRDLPAPGILLPEHSSAQVTLAREIFRGFGYIAYRFDLSIPQSHQMQAIQYVVEFPQTAGIRDASVAFETQRFTFYVPGIWDHWKFIFYSCNGYSESVDKIEMGKPGVGGLWREGASWAGLMIYMFIQWRNASIYCGIYHRD